MKIAAVVLELLLLTAPAAAQEGGWHYSPYPGEGDRAALGCSPDSGPDSHTCLAVRCEDDFTVGLYVDTTRPGGDAGNWALQIDDVTYALAATAALGAPYRARATGDVEGVLEALRTGIEAFLDPVDGDAASSRQLPLTNSLAAINQALFFCAPLAEEPEATVPVIDPDLVAPIPAEPSAQLTR